MLNLEFSTEKDRREAAKLEKRRIFEEERKKRIFDPKKRLIGVDTAALESQMVENRKRRDDEKRVDQVFIDQLKKADELAVAYAEKDRRERFKIELEINKFRQNFQRPEDRREYDLNDPNLIKKQLPVRINDDDPRLGPSSAQKFEGEDIVSEERQKIQREQLKSWLDQQMMEKQQADKERKVALEAYRSAVIARDQRAMELNDMEKDCKKKLEIAIQRFNTALAEERKIRAANIERQTKEDNLAEIYNAMTSNMLTENPDVADSNLGPGRKIGYLYKGMTDADKAKFREDLLRQIQENQKARQIEKRMNREFEEYYVETQKTVHIIDKGFERETKKNIAKLKEENRKLAEEQKSRQQYLKNIVYNNTVSDQYFDQFNTTTR